MSRSEFFLDAGMEAARIRERMSLEDVFSNTRFMTGVFAALTILGWAYIAWLEWEHRRLEKRLSQELSQERDA